MFPKRRSSKGSGLLWSGCLKLWLLLWSCGWRRYLHIHHGIHHRIHHGNHHRIHHRIHHGIPFNWWRLLMCLWHRPHPDWEARHSHEQRMSSKQRDSGHHGLCLQQRMVDHLRCWPEFAADFLQPMLFGHRFSWLGQWSWREGLSVGSCTAQRALQQTARGVPQGCTLVSSPHSGVPLGAGLCRQEETGCRWGHCQLVCAERHYHPILQGAFLWRSHWEHWPFCFKGLQLTWDLVWFSCLIFNLFQFISILGHLLWWLWWFVLALYALYVRLTYCMLKERYRRGTDGPTCMCNRRITIEPTPRDIQRHPEIACPTCRSWILPRWRIPSQWHGRLLWRVGVWDRGHTWSETVQRPWASDHSPSFRHGTAIREPTNPWWRMSLCLWHWPNPDRKTRDPRARLGLSQQQESLIHLGFSIFRRLATSFTKIWKRPSATTATLELCPLVPLVAISQLSGAICWRTSSRVVHSNDSKERKGKRRNGQTAAKWIRHWFCDGQILVV